jgi:hypothetical protein
MFSINLKLESYWLFLLIFETVSHKTNGSGQKGKCKIKLWLKEKFNLLSGQKKCKFFYGQKEFPQ